jgi:hypothetical protein
MTTPCHRKNDYCCLTLPMLYKSQEVQQICVFGHHHIQHVHFYTSITFTTMQLIAKWLRKENMKCWLGIPYTIAKTHQIWIDLKLGVHHLHNAYFHTSIHFAIWIQTTPWLRQNKNTIYKSQKVTKVNGFENLSQPFPYISRLLMFWRNLVKSTLHL